MNNKIVYGGLVVAIVIATVSLVKTPDTIVGSQGLRGEQGVQGPVGPQGPAGKDGKDGKNAGVLGAVSGPDTYFEYTANQDLQKYPMTKGLTVATTTVCAIKSPSSTSTLALGGIRLSVSSSTATVVTLAKAATPYATTTRLGFGSISANAQGTVVVNATTTGTGITSQTDAITTFSPNTYFVVGMQGGIGTFSPVGSCSAEFVRI